MAAQQPSTAPVEATPSSGTNAPPPATVAAATVAPAPAAPATTATAATTTEPQVSATNLFVANLPDSANDDTLKSLFSSFGTIVSCKVMIDFNTGRSRGFGFVKYETSEQAQQAIQVMNGVSVEGKQLTVKPANSSEPSQTPTNNIYIKGLPLQFTQKDLDALFSRFGTITESRILIDATTQLSRGIGFVRFQNVDEGTLAIRALNNFALPGASRPLLVKFADTEAEKAQRKAKQQTRRPPTLPEPAPYPLATASFPTFYPALLSSSGYTTPIYTTAPPTQLPLPTPGDESNLYVYNLPAEADDSLLFKIFGHFGAIHSVRVAKDKETQQCRGYGFVRFVSFQDACTAINATNGVVLGNKVLSVSFKTPSRNVHGSAPPSPHRMMLPRPQLRMPAHHLFEVGSLQ